MLETVSLLPGWLATLLLAMSPISELRGAIPLAIQVYGYSPIEAYLLSVFGNLIPVVLLLLFLEPVSRYLMQFSIGHSFFTWLFSRTERKYIVDHQSFGLLALMIFVAIPMPVTGAWTGCAIAFLMGFRFKEAFLAIMAGVLLAGFVVTSTVVGLKWLLI